jgi:hypothetical protein
VPVLGRSYCGAYVIQLELPYSEIFCDFYSQRLMSVFYMLSYISIVDTYEGKRYEDSRDIQDKF